jgi:hypothetical protein
MNESDHHPCGWISSTIDNSINVNFNELSFIHMVISYQCYSDVHVSFYINILNIRCQFQSCEQVSFMCSNFIQVIYYCSCCQFHPRDETQTYGPIPSMSKFIEKQQVQPYGSISFMWSSSSKCIIHVVKIFMDFIRLP